MGELIFINAGHGGKDSGAVGYGLRESDINLIVALRVKARLEAHGFRVVMDRMTDVFNELGEICRRANASGAKYFVSIHHNAGGGKGYEVIRALSGGKSLELANNIAKCFAEIGQVTHGSNPVYAKQGKNGSDYYAVIRGTNMPAVITEFGFIDNNVDVAKFNTLEKQYKEAEAICKAICIQAGVKYVSQDSNSCNTVNKADNSGIRKGKVVATALNVRRGSKAGEVIGVLKQGDIIEITNTKDGWHLARCKVNGKYVSGFVCADYVKGV